ncbi:hypothetical protein ON010_g18535 [Phytophthora cinnamomi]|nr:hypothetical protein ON010_g18535 [Phytophthora cinnamomi]
MDLRRRESPRKTSVTQGGERAIIADKMHKYFTSAIHTEANQKQKKTTYGRCGKREDHNASKCPNRSDGNLDSDV